MFIHHLSTFQVLLSFGVVGAAIPFPFGDEEGIVGLPFPQNLPEEMAEASWDSQ